jgi:osmoprotectant transport system ATP-binding protein
MISLKNVSKYYDGKPAVSDLSLQITEGELCVLIGPSGCGKSTTLRMINRMVEPDGGAVFVGNRDVRSVRTEDLRKSIGYVIQSTGLFPHMTVSENIGVVPSLLKWEIGKIKRRVTELLDLIGLDATLYSGRYPRELSGGEAQRVGVARALAADPPVLLMDEPFGAVDPPTRTRLQAEFLRIQRQLKKTVVFVTHDVEEAVRLSDKIAVLREGVLVQYDVPEAFITSPANPFITDFLGPDYALKMLSRRYVKDYSANLPASRTVPLLPRIGEKTTMKEALSRFVSSGSSRLVVESGNGTPVGQLDLQSLLESFRGKL